MYLEVEVSLKLHVSWGSCKRQAHLSSQVVPSNPFGDCCLISKNLSITCKSKHVHMRS